MMTTPNSSTDSGIITRARASKMREQPSQSPAGDTQQQWIKANNQTQGKEFLQKRIEAYLPFISDDHLVQEARALLRNNTSSFPAMLQFVTDKLNLNSVRNHPHTPGKTYIQRAEFLEPFTIDMERADNSSLTIFQKSTTYPPPSEIISEKRTSTNEPQETIESESTPENTKVTPRDYLQKFCLDSYGTPMEYNTFQNSKNGKHFWETVITHPESIMLPVKQ